MAGKNMNKGLGRGLGALLGDEALESRASAGAVTLRISEIEPNSTQPRKLFDESALYDLSESIREHGILQPVSVRRLSSGRYGIIAGERRWRAARMAGLSEIPAIIFDADDRKSTELALIENLQREDLNPVEEADGYRSLMTEFGLTQEEASKRVGKSRPQIANMLRLLTLPDDILTLVRGGTLSAGHARALIPVPSQQRQIKLAEKIVNGDLSVRQTEALVKAATAGDNENAELSEAKERLNHLAEVESRLSENLGRRVKIVPGKKKGRFEIEFYGLDDLDLLIAAIGRLKL